MPKIPQPEIVNMPAQKMAVVYARGDPNDTFSKVIKTIIRYEEKRQHRPSADSTARTEMIK